MNGFGGHTCTYTATRIFLANEAEAVTATPLYSTVYPSVNNLTFIISVIYSHLLNILYLQAKD